MSFSIVKDGDRVIATVPDQLIVGNRQELKRCVLEALDDGERKFVVDLHQTRYVDSAGLGALVAISARIRERGGELRLANLNDDLRSLFELTRLDTLFVIDGDEDRPTGGPASLRPSPPSPREGEGERPDERR